MLLVHCDGELYLQRRPVAGIWGGLWSLPELDSIDAVSKWCAQTLHADAAEVDYWDTLRHSFSHFDLDIKPIAVRLESLPQKVSDSDQELWYTLAQPPGIGLAAPVRTLIDSLQQTGSTRMSRTVNCVLLGKEAEGMDYVPYPGELGQRIYDGVSKEAWQRWLGHQTMLINENRLTPIEPEARKFLETEMEKFFFGGGSAKPVQYVPK